MLNVEQELLELLLLQEHVEYKAAVGVVQYKDRWLLGLAKDTGDDRSGTWVCAGGHIKRGESPKKAAEREIFEETGVRVKAVGEPFTLPEKKGVAFVHCKVTGVPKLVNNCEFSALGFFRYRELKSLKLYRNVIKLIDKVK